MSFLSYETDILIMGGGPMGTALARQAATLGIRSIVLENEALAGPHYASGFYAPRADYLPININEVVRTDSDCAVWRYLFPHMLKPRLFILICNNNAPYGFDCFKSLMELYDGVTP